jgi:hypothetical protein
MIVQGGSMSDEKLLDFVSKRKENIEEKRRNFERIMFRNFLGAYTVLDNGDAVYPVDLVDISYDGCLFQIPWNVKNDSKYPVDTEITFRMYFTRDSYIPVVAKVKYGKEHVGKDNLTYMHYGCEFDRSMTSFDALQSFIDFLYKFAEHSSLDRGDSRMMFL